ncbi:uncharacterized protein [Leptinotarsa decemlineata]|uniref:uncharacterized protein n=1 Tax=Leptinotarsa decemlineata TaxID=7539 RepID=UPI003D306566
MYKSRGRVLVEMAKQYGEFSKHSTIETAGQSTEAPVDPPQYLPTLGIGNELETTPSSFPEESLRNKEMSIRKAGVNLEESSRSSCSTDIVDDSDADPDYSTETEAPFRKRRRINHVAISKSDFDISSTSSSSEGQENVRPQGVRLGKQRKQRKAVLKRPYLT